MTATRSDNIHFIEPMYALVVQNIPEGKEWLYEVKFDGYRCLAGRDKNGVTLWSRRGNLFTSQFAHIAHACERLPGGTLLDGEMVAIVSGPIIMATSHLIFRFALTAQVFSSGFGD